MDDLLTLIHFGSREGMTDVYVALKRLRRRGGARTRDVPTGLTGADLERAIDGFGLQFPGRVVEVPA